MVDKKGLDGINGLEWNERIDGCDSWLDGSDVWIYGWMKYKKLNDIFSNSSQ